MRRVSRAAGAWFVGIMGTTLGAQTATITGTVLRDSSETPLGGALVVIAALTRSTQTNYAGEFRLNALPAGRVVVTVQKIGYVPLTDTVTLADGAREEREYVLIPQVQRLDSVTTTAAAAPRYISPGLQEFEERRKAGRGGYFITEEVIRKNENRTMVDVVLSNVPGLQRFRMPPFEKYYLGTMRKCVAGPALRCTGSSFCPVSLYVNGSLVFNSANAATVSPPDFTAEYRPSEIAAVEYYPGGASMPIKYSMTDGGCGTLLIWTREG